MLDLVLEHVRLPQGRCVDIGVRHGLVFQASDAGPSVERIDCSDYLVLPGALDMHVHMRGGPQSHKEDWETGSKSALAGGVTVVVDQPNTDPPLDSVERFLARVEDGKRRALCGFAVNAAVTPEADLEGLFAAGAMAFGETFVAASSYGEALDEGDLTSALRRINALSGCATLHLEEPAPGAPCTLEEHDRLRPLEGEWHALKRVLSLSPPGMHLHCCHLTSPEAIRGARAAGATVEVTPHHLLLDLGKFAPGDARGRVNPPLRPPLASAALWNALGLVDVVASDHAPHTFDEKAVPFHDAPSGLPGVETMMPLLVARVRAGALSIERLIDLTVTGPARILGIPPAGFTRGNRADFALYPLGETPVDAARLHSRCGWTPYDGMPAVFPEQVVMNGELVYEYGKFAGLPGAWFAGKGYIG
ncbi:Dihydroorotase [anaerobic digester metagenome]